MSLETNKKKNLFSINMNSNFFSRVFTSVFYSAFWISLNRVAFYYKDIKNIQTKCLDLFGEIPPETWKVILFKYNVVVLTPLIVFLILLFVLNAEHLVQVFKSKVSVTQKICISLYLFVYSSLGSFFVANSYFIHVFLASLSDTFGYIFGKIFKGPKLTKISPSKTISGLIGTMFGAWVFFLLVDLKSFNKLIYVESYFRKINEFSPCAKIALSCLVGLVGQAGDISVSFIKRKLSIKDFSNIFPGHGGLWDRMDSVFAIAIVMSILRCFT
ncbi:phosphatidate cytidylyltransferase [Candidatus Nesciobacter abundans]|uniref:Phosphatidate cytidylyltransferase n=1 Tax=Candidatus Nesciobacter abundans TaxID=2601668 RepID=A0A5C0UHQ7_9PROT|nr:phosphatidate cytidylyltransferase [Candidatus Nesciobacter abundans]QEK39240.1 hypothetical protein FZC36_02280 [Candidatus Nesciobacter abundans]